MSNLIPISWRTRVNLSFINDGFTLPIWVGSVNHLQLYCSSRAVQEYAASEIFIPTVIKNRPWKSHLLWLDLMFSAIFIRLRTFSLIFTDEILIYHKEKSLRSNTLLSDWWYNGRPLQRVYTTIRNRLISRYRKWLYMIFSRVTIVLSYPALNAKTNKEE